MNVIYSNEEARYYIEEYHNNQNYIMAFCERWHEPSNTLYYNVWLSISSKRKHRFHNEDLKLSTGKDIFFSIKWAINAFNELEKYVLKDNLENYNIVIYCWWVDNRRRDAYYKVLSKKGYTYQYIRPDECNKKVIAKRWEQSELYVRDTSKEEENLCELH